MNQPFIGDYPRPELTHWFCMACRQHGMYKYGEHHCGEVPQVDRLAAERDAAVAQVARLSGTMNDASKALDGTHVGDCCTRRGGRCDCIIGIVRAALATEETK